MTGRARCDGCKLDQVCAYAYCFETAAVFPGKFHSVGQEVPRPYVLRVPPQLPDDVERGRLAFELVLFGKACELLPYLVIAVTEWGKPGRGPGGQPVRLACVETRHPFSGQVHRVYGEEEGALSLPRWEVTVQQLEAAASGLPGERAVVHFLTPTLLKFQGRKVDVPYFRILVSSLLRRLEALENIHALERIVEDPRDLIRLSEGIALEKWEGRQEPRRRYSARQRRVMKVEGFAGRAVYEGDLEPFRVLLRLGELTHVGKGAVMGLGQIVVATEEQWTGR